MNMGFGQFWYLKHNLEGQCQTGLDYNYKCALQLFPIPVIFVLFQ